MTTTLPPGPTHGPWPAPVTVWGHRWPGPTRPADAATSVAVTLVAAVAAISLPLERPGLGWLLTAIIGVAALGAAHAWPHQPPAGLPPALRTPPAVKPDPIRYGWTAATVALLAVGAFRAADWLFVLCVATALLTTTFAVAGGRSLRAMTLAVLMAPFAGLRALPWLGRARRQRLTLRAAGTAGVSIALLLVFGALFTSADRDFAGLVRSGVPEITPETLVRWCFVFAATLGVAGGAAYLRAAPPDLTGLDGPGRRTVARWEWSVPLVLLTALFATFVAVQLTALFGGSRHVRETAGLTYADYARGGFWQLLAVTVLTLGVLAGAVRWAPRTTRTDRILIRAVLGALAGLTLIITASALHRMNVYADTYGLTRLRLLVALCEAWLGVLLVLVLVAGVRLRAAWLPRTAAAIAVAALLGLAAANPDARIADHNVTRWERTQRIDLAYLSDLSADAVPALHRLPAQQREQALLEVDQALRVHPDDWRTWNLGRERARELLGAG